MPIVSPYQVYNGVDKLIVIVLALCLSLVLPTYFKFLVPIICLSSSLYFLSGSPFLSLHSFASVPPLPRLIAMTSYRFVSSSFCSSSTIYFSTSFPLLFVLFCLSLFLYGPGITSHTGCWYTTSYWHQGSLTMWKKVI